MIRTHEAGTLRPAQAGERVTLAGWVARRRDHGGVVFIDLRDASGVVQVVFRGEGEDRPEHALRAEFCIQVTGEVRPRPAGNENPELPTGEVEVVADEPGGLVVLSEADPLPFPIEGGGELSEDVRLRYRYLDIRRAEMTAALRLRSEATYLAGEVLRAHRFVYVETPYLTRSTPEGARDFLVPVRLRPGNWYALPQSPQLFKQLLMVGGLERYYQLARCFRDEDFRADRQPEFTQIDLELSFVDREDVIEVSEDLVGRLWAELAGYRVPRPIPRMTYAEAMRRFGSDKPDLRFGCELADLTAYFGQTSFRVFQAPHVGAVVMPGGAGQTRRELDGWQEWARARGARGLAYVLIGQDGMVSESGPVVRHLSDAEKQGWPARPARGRETASSSPPGPPPRPVSCSAPPGWRSASGWASSIPASGRSCGWLTPPCSKRTARAAGPRSTIRSPPHCRNGRTSSPSSRPTPSPTPTTSSSTAPRSAADRCVSTSHPFSSRSST